MTKKKNKKKSKARTVEVDWNDEASVLAAMASTLEEPEEDISIEEDRGLSSFGEGTFYLVKVGRVEYQVAEDHDAAEKLAIAIVSQDLEHEPEIFERDFLARHINTDQLRRDLMSDVQNMRHEDLADEARRRPIEFMKEHDIDIPSPSDEKLERHAKLEGGGEDDVHEILRKLRDMDPEDQWTEIGDEPEVSDHQIEEVAEQEAEAQLKDPLQYLEEIYGDEATAKAIEMAGINISEAAEAAVKEDGVEHFVARYDNYMHDGPGGIVYWRSN